jgi:hypothetical protein
MGFCLKRNSQMTGKAAQPVPTHQQAALTHQMAIPFQTRLGAANFISGGFSLLGWWVGTHLRRLHSRTIKFDTRKTYKKVEL